jgi:hypothetical protein
MLGPPSGGKDGPMHTGRLVLAQILDLLSRWNLAQCVRRYRGDHRTRNFTCWQQFVVMAFAQLTFRESLRDIETCLEALGPKLYHAGLHGPVARSTLAEANEGRDWRIWADLAQGLIAEARGLYAHDSFGVRLKATTYAFDATTIDLCLKLFPWCRFRRRKSAVKLHTLLDLRGAIPSFVSITPGSVHEVNVLDELTLEPGAYYLMDRGYVDFARLYRFTRQQAYFVTRPKDNLDYHVRESRPVDRSTGLRADQSIRLQGPLSRQRYPELLRRISYTDVATDTHYVFLSNNFALAASTICQLYHCRWQVELFFKWIKQHLRIKAFFGHSENAVKTQLWIAVCVYVLVAIMKKRLDLSRSMGEILQVLSLTLFEKSPILQVFSHDSLTNPEDDFYKPLPLLDI